MGCVPDNCHLRSRNFSLIGFALLRARPIVVAIDQQYRNVNPIVLRSPSSQQKMRYQSKSQTVIHRSKMHPVLKRTFEVFPVLGWLAALTARIPNQGEHLVRYHGWVP